MLSSLELLDEEEVAFLKEVGSLHMPKYRSLVRRLTHASQTDRRPLRSPREPKPAPTAAAKHGERRTPRYRRPNEPTNPTKERSSPARIQVPADSEEHEEQSRAASRSGELSAASLEVEGSDSTIGTAQVQESKPKAGHQPPDRLVVKESATNTDVDLEKEILRREQVVATKETAFLEKEKEFLARENAFFVKEQDFKAQIAQLQEALEAASIRAAKAEATVLDMSTHLLQKEREQTAATAASDESADALKQSQSTQQDAWEAKLAVMEAEHRQEMEQQIAEKKEPEKKVAAMEAESAVLARNLQETEAALQEKAAALGKSESKAAELAGELDLTRKANASAVSQLSGDVQYHKERAEQSDKRSTQLEKQVAELQTSVEAVYNKCIEKEEAAQQLKKSLAARQDELEALRLQHVKDSERQDKLQQQQQDLYERQLQASVIQVEMEFRKEHHQSAQKFHLLQRKYQERLKEIKRVRETYQLSLQREAAAKSELESLQAVLAGDKQKLFVQESSRSDAFEAEIRDEKERSKELELLLAEEQTKNAQLVALSGQTEELRGENDRLRGVVQTFEQQSEVWKTEEDDLRAALKVKDVMLADQRRQIQELHDDRQQLERHFNDEMADFQAQIEELEAALDENLQRTVDEEVKCETLSAELAALAESAPQKEQQLESLRAELEQKVAALEFLDQEMQRMRAVLEDQDELFQKRMQKHLEQHREELEWLRVAAEETREHQRLEWEAERGEMVHRYQALAAEMEKMAAQNAKLRVDVDQERRQNAQNDRDMRILLAQVPPPPCPRPCWVYVLTSSRVLTLWCLQIDRERHSKKENLRQIKSLFEQLQKDAA
ncbi:hypothetical protein BBJ28_00015776 [Nothophytophthora sp. Chile5]|nr:hypothetical protein BBJ28_00015776 [Nothophytophthora sp. Chile5]